MIEKRNNPVRAQMQLHFLIQISDVMWYEHERSVREPQGNFGMFYNHSAVRSHSKCCQNTATVVNWQVVSVTMAGTFTQVI